MNNYECITTFFCQSNVVFCFLSGNPRQKWLCEVRSRGDRRRMSSEETALSEVALRLEALRSSSSPQKLLQSFRGPQGETRNALL